MDIFLSHETLHHYLYHNNQKQALLYCEKDFSLREIDFRHGGSSTLLYVTAFHSAGVTWVPSLPLSHPASRLPHSDLSVTLAFICLNLLALQPPTQQTVLCSDNNAAVASIFILSC